MMDLLGTPLNKNTYLYNSNYKIIDIIGQGGFSFIYRVIDSKGNEYAIKEYFSDNRHFRGLDNYSVYKKPEYDITKDIAYRKNFIQEANLLYSLSHPNIISSYKYFEENNTLYSVMPLIHGITLYDYTHINKVLSEEESLSIISQLAHAVRYLHSLGICHYDIKPVNIMMQNGNPILIDFGLARNYKNKDLDKYIYPTVTAGYTPLELFEKDGVNSFSPETDIFGLGATLFFMITGTDPPSLKKIWHGSLIKELHGFSSQIQMLIKVTLQILPQRRYRNIESFIQALPI